MEHLHLLAEMENHSYLAQKRLNLIPKECFGV